MATTKARTCTICEDPTHTAEATRVAGHWAIACSECVEWGDHLEMSGGGPILIAVPPDDPHAIRLNRVQHWLARQPHRASKTF